MATPRYSSRSAAPGEAQQSQAAEHEVLVIGGQSDRHPADTVEDRLIAHLTPEVVEALGAYFRRVHYDPLVTEAQMRYWEGQQSVVIKLKGLLARKAAG